MAYTGYHFFIDGMELPYAPSKLSITIGSNNKTVELINGSEINILKNPKLTEIKFDAELPRGRQYAFANKLVEPEIFLEHFEKIMVNKKPVELVITRPNPNGFGNRFYSNDITVSLEGYELKEDAGNAFDVVVSLSFKQYINHGTVKKVNSGNSVVPPQKPNDTVTGNQTYIVQKGDCLWSISRKFYGDGALYMKIYNANTKVIEDAASKYGKKSSYKGTTAGWWIYAGTKLIIPPKT